MGIHVTSGMETALARTRTATRAPLSVKLKRQKYLLLFLLPCVALTFVFSYMPLWGLLMAFMDYRPGKAFFDNPWVGFKHFEYFIFQSGDFVRILRNSIVLSLLAMGTTIPLAVAFAIVLQELRSVVFKRVVQTISYFPHFVSWAIVATIFFQFLSLEGWLNAWLQRAGFMDSPYFFLGEPRLIWPILTVANLWKEIGWSSIVFLAAIASVDPSLYDASYVDGANRWQRIRHVTVPGMMPTISIIVILSAGSILNTGFEQYYLMGSPATWAYSDVIDTYVVRHGLNMGQFSFATAVGLFKTAVSLIVLGIVNNVLRKTNGYSLW